MLSKRTIEFCSNCDFLSCFDFDYDTLETQADRWAHNIALNFNEDEHDDVYDMLYNKAIEDATSLSRYKDEHRAIAETIADTEGDGSIASINTKKVIWGSENSKLHVFESRKTVKFKDCTIKAVFVANDASARKVGISTSGKQLADLFTYGMSCCPWECLWHTGKTQVEINGNIETIEKDPNAKFRDLACWDFGNRASYTGILVKIVEGYVVDGNYNPLTLIEFVGCLKAAFGCDESTVLKTLSTNAFFTRTDPHHQGKKDSFLVVWKRRNN